MTYIHKVTSQNSEKDCTQLYNVVIMEELGKEKFVILGLKLEVQGIERYAKKT